MVSIVPEQPEVETLGLLSNELYLVGRPEWNKFPEQKSSPELLEHLPLIFREAGSGTRLVNEKFINDHQLKVKRRLELSSNEAVKQAVLAGLGCSIMPRIGIKQELASGELVIIPVQQLPVVTQWNLVWRKGKAFSPAANAFLMYLNSEKEFLKSAYCLSKWFTTFQLARNALFSPHYFLWPYRCFWPTLLGIKRLNADHVEC